MTIRTPESLSLFIDLVSDGVSLNEASIAIGAAPGSKIAFLWLQESRRAEAYNFEAPPAESEPYCVVQNETPQWFHAAYRDAVIAGRVARSIRRTPLRSDLQAKLHAKRTEPPKSAGYLPPRVMVGKPSDEPANPVTRDLPAPPPPPRARPSYAYKSRPIDGIHGEQGPPLDGRFRMSGDRPKSLQERRAGTVEITDTGVRRW